MTEMRDEDVTALRNEIHRLEMLVEGMVEAAAELVGERDELRSVIQWVIDTLGIKIA